MAYEFTKLSEVLDIETVSDECNVIIEDGGEIKKTAKSNIGKAQVQADWNQTDPTQPDYIKNKLSCDSPYQQLVTDADGNAVWEDRLAYDNKESASFALCTSGYARFPQGRDYYDVPDEMWKLLLNENATIIDEVSGAVMMNRRVDESNGVVYYSTGASSGVTELYVSTIYKQAYLFDIGLPDAVIGKERHTVTASIGDIKQIDQKFIPPQTVYVNATGGNDTDGDGILFTDVALDKTYDEISALLSRGVDVKIIRENLILDCLSFNEEGIVFFAYYPVDDNALVLCWIRNDNSAVMQIVHLTDFFLPIDNNGVLIAPLILQSSTPGSNKKFRISVDDSGAVSATEV